MFGLGETERITIDEPQSTDIAMGAALVLDSPAQGFMYRYFKTLDLPKSLDVSESIPIDIGTQVDLLCGRLSEW